MSEVISPCWIYGIQAIVRSCEKRVLERGRLHARANSANSVEMSVRTRRKRFVPIQQKGERRKTSDAECSQTSAVENLAGTASRHCHRRVGLCLHGLPAMICELMPGYSAYVVLLLCSTTLEGQQVDLEAAF